MTKIFRPWAPLFLAMVLIAGSVVLAPPLTWRIAYAAERARQDATRDELADLSMHDQLSQLFRAVAEVVKPAVVEVRTTKEIEMPDFFSPFGDDRLPLPFRFRFRGPRGRGRRSQRQMGLGSGVVVDAKNGYVLTNYHVVGKVDEVEVILADGRKFEGKWVRGDALSDLAVVKIEADRLTEAPLGDSDEAKVGDWVLAIGSPRGLPQTVTAGIISAKGRHPRLGRGGMYQDSLQTDAAINKGNSGGPLVNMKGEVIGINNAIASESGGNEGIGFAIPSNMARDVMKQLIDKGKVVRGFLGIQMNELTEAGAKALELPDTEGVLVSKVVEDSPADKAGIRIEDVIVRVDGKKTPGTNQLRNLVASIAPGETVEVVIYRKGRKKTLKVTIELQPKDMFAGVRVPGVGGEGERVMLGIRVVNLTEDRAKKYGYEEVPKGVLIAAVEDDSEAAEQGLRQGMVITHVQGEEIESVKEFTKALEGVKAPKVLRMRAIDPAGNARLIFLELKDS